MLPLSIIGYPVEDALASATTTNTVMVASNTSTSSSIIEDMPITQKVYFDVRISRSDGTFYVRDDDPPDNSVYRGRLTVGLFGTAAPNHVANFLKYVNVTADNALSDTPYPSYARSMFSSLDDTTGLISSGNIPGLEVSNIQGSAAIRYRDRVLSAPLWIEEIPSDSDSSAPLPTSISHTAKGLLTHRKLDLSPSFGITTYSDSRQLDGTHQVFGRLLDVDDLQNANGNNSSYKEFLNRCSEISRYSVDRPPAVSEEGVGRILAANVYEKQQKFFRGAAKAAGDTRIGKTYEGKFLRRVDVTQVGLL